MRGRQHEAEAHDLRAMLKNATENLTTSSIAQAIMDGRLPEYFRESVSHLNRVWTEKLGLRPDAYVQEMLRRDFRGIVWKFSTLLGLHGI